VRTSEKVVGECFDLVDHCGNVLNSCQFTPLTARASGYIVSLNIGGNNVVL